MAHDLPPWKVVYDQAQRWITAGVFEDPAHDLCAALRCKHRRITQGREPQPTAAILESRTLQSSPESGGRVGYAGAKLQAQAIGLSTAVDTLGHLRALCVTAASAQDHAPVEQLAAKVREVIGASVELVYVGQGYTGEQPAADAAAHGIQLEVINLPEAKRGFALLPRRWVVSAVLCRRSFGWLARFRRPARDDERLPETLAGLHFVAFVILLLPRFVRLMAYS